MNLKHLLMLPKIKFYRHLHLSENFLHNLVCVGPYILSMLPMIVWISFFLPQHVATETAMLGFLSYVYDWL